MPNFKKILIVEDNHINALVATKFLHLWGYQSEVAVSGKDAVKLCLDQQYDLILMDLQMPEMDGFEASKSIRENGFSNPIIALSADSYYLIEDKLSQAGIDSFVAKPLNPEELKNAILQRL